MTCFWQRLYKEGASAASGSALAGFHPFLVMFLSLSLVNKFGWPITQTRVVADVVPGLVVVFRYSFMTFVFGGTSFRRYCRGGVPFYLAAALFFL